MASYSARRRDPLFDSATQATLERRGKELLGFAFIAMGLAIAALLATYVPEDPSWLTATDAPAANMLGRLGASIASPLYIIAGMGSWGLALVLLTPPCCSQTSPAPWLSGPADRCCRQLLLSSDPCFVLKRPWQPALLIRLGN